jgi:hypothetical protein
MPKCRVKRTSANAPTGHPAAAKSRSLNVDRVCPSKAPCPSGRSSARSRGRSPQKVAARCGHRRDSRLQQDGRVEYYNVTSSGPPVKLVSTR